MMSVKIQICNAPITDLAVQNGESQANVTLHRYQRTARCDAHEHSQQQVRIVYQRCSDVTVAGAKDASITRSPWTWGTSVEISTAVDACGRSGRR